MIKREIDRRDRREERLDRNRDDLRKRKVEGKTKNNSYSKGWVPSNTIVYTLTNNYPSNPF